MNLYHLKIFTYVAKCKSVTVAAKELGISQPAVSHQLHDFQQRIGL